MFQYLQSQSGRQLFLLPLHYVKEIIPYAPDKSPHSPEQLIVSHTFFRGQEIPVINPSAFPGEAPDSTTPPRYLTLFTLHGNCVGIPIQQAGQIVTIADDELLPPPAFLSQNHCVLACWMDKRKRLNNLLDAHELLRMAADRDRSFDGISLQGQRLTLQVSPSDSSEFQYYEQNLSDTGIQIDRWESRNPDSQGPVIRALATTAFRDNGCINDFGEPPARITISPSTDNPLSPHGRLHLYRQGIDLPLSQDCPSSFLSLKVALTLSLFLIEK